MSYQQFNPYEGYENTGGGYQQGAPPANSGYDQGGYQMQSNQTMRPSELNTQDFQNKPQGVFELFGVKLDPKLVVSKTFYFFFYAAFGSLFPLIAVYFKQLGLNPTQVGFLIGIRPVVDFVSAPFWGRFVDRYKKGRYLLLGSLLSWILFTLAIVFIQPATPFCLDYNSTHAILVPNDRQIMQKAKDIESGDTPQDTDSLYPTFDTLANIGIRPNPHRWGPKPGGKIGTSPVYINENEVANYDPARTGGALVRSPFSTRVFRKKSVDEVFLLLLVLVLLGEFFSSPAVNLADTCVLEYVQESPHLFLKQRMMGSLGWAISMFIVGFALDYASAFSQHPCHTIFGTKEKNYSLNFAVFSVLMGVATLAATQFHFSQQTEGDRPDNLPSKIMDANATRVAAHVAENARARAPEAQEASRGPRWLSTMKTFSGLHYGTLLVVTVWMGYGMGLVFAFLFWHLQDLGGTPSLFGVASVINHVSEVFAYFYSFKLINRFGHMKVIYLGLLVNFARFLYVSLLRDPWWVLPFEMVQGVTHATVWSAISSYVSLTAPAQQKASAQSLVTNLHHGVGKGVGALLSGIIITYAGSAMFFQLYSLFSLVLFGVFFGINKFKRADGFKYQTDFLDDGSSALAPHGIPMNVPYSVSEDRIAENLVSNPEGSYGAVQDATQDAYDRYIHEPHDKPVRFDALPDLK